MDGWMDDHADADDVVCEEEEEEEDIKIEIEKHHHHHQ